MRAVMGIGNLVTKPPVLEASFDESTTRSDRRRSRVSFSGLAFVIGALCGVLPAVFLYTPVLRGPEAAGLVASVLYVQRFGIEWLQDTQDVFLPYLVIGPAMSLAGVAGAYIVTALSLVSLTGIVCYIARKLGLTLLAAVTVAVGTLSFPVILSSAKDLPMYLPMLSFGYLGTWLVYHAGSGNARRRLLAAACGGLCVVLAAESHGIGQLFYAAPLLTLVLNPTRRGLLALGTSYGSAILFSIPRLLINLSEGGLSHIRGTRTDYWVTEGYLDLINTEFWGHPVSVSRWEYLAGMDQQVAEAVGQFGALVGVLAITSIFIVRARQRWFIASCVALMVVPLIIITPPQFPRYLAPIVPGIALLAGVTMDFLLDKTR